MKKPKLYEVTTGYQRGGKECFIVREQGNGKVSGWIAASWGPSKGDRERLERLVEQANICAELARPTTGN